MCCILLRAVQDCVIGSRAPVCWGLRAASMTVTTHMPVCELVHMLIWLSLFRAKLLCECPAGGRCSLRALACSLLVSAVISLSTIHPLLT